ncbi:MAG: RNA polymerase sigma factor [Candidatus Obscuribacterales bacterium]|nr:RNA polymerase sigma factor [Candidatus Obscuribacterales bacterium]
MLVSRTFNLIFKQVHFLASEFASSSHDAEDIAQTTLLNFCRHKKAMAAAMRCRAYLRTAVRNTAYDFYSRQNNYNQLVNPQYSFDPVTSCVQVRETTVHYPSQRNDYAVMREEIGAAIKALNKLDPIYREILLLVAQGFRYKEIAERLDIPLGTARSRIHNARRQLTKLID